MQRQMNDHELDAAKHVLGWQHWAPPLVTSLMCLAFLIYAWQEEPEARIITFVFLGPFAGFLWFIFLRNRQRVQRDIGKGTIEVVEGPLTKVWRSRYGAFFISIGGKKIHVPAEIFNDLRNATTVTIEYLPESCIALNVKPHYGLHLK